VLNLRPISLLTYLLTNSAVRYCSDGSKNRFDLESTIGQTFGHSNDTNRQVKVNGRSTVRSFNFNTV